MQRAREAAGLDLRTAAKRLRLSPAYLRQIEAQGACALTWRRAKQIARLYGIDVSQLLRKE